MYTPFTENTRGWQHARKSSVDDRRPCPGLARNGTDHPFGEATWPFPSVERAIHSQERLDPLTYLLRRPLCTAVLALLGPLFTPWLGAERTIPSEEQLEPSTYLLRRPLCTAVLIFLGAALSLGGKEGRRAACPRAACPLFSGLGARVFAVRHNAGSDVVLIRAVQASSRVLVSREKQFPHRWPELQPR